MMQVAFAPMWFFAMLMFSGGLLPLPPGVPPLDEDPALMRAAPEGTLLFVEWFGVGEADPESSNETERLAAEPEIRALLDTVESALRAAARSEAPGGAAAFLEAALDLGRNAFTRPGCIFISGVTLPPEDPSVSGGLIVNVGEKASDMARSVREVETVLLEELSRGGGAGPSRMVDVGEARFRELTLPPPAPPIAWGFSGKYLVLAVGAGMPAKIVEGLESGPGLAGDAAFEKMHASVAVERPASRSYVDVAGIIEKAGALGGPGVMGLLDALGLTNVTAMVSESGLEGKGFVMKSFVGTRGVPSGLLRLAEGKPLTDAEMAWIPADATLAAAFRLDAEAIYKEFLTVLGRIDRRAREEFLEEFESGIQRELGLGLVEDLLRPLGDTWCVWNSPGEGGLVFTGLTAAVAVKDRDRLSRTIDRLTEIARQEMGRHGGSGRYRRGAFIESFTCEGEKVHFLNIVGEEVPVAPAWCLTDTHLLVSPYPQMIKAALARGPSAEKSLAGAPVLKERGKALAVMAADAKSLFRTLYPVLHPLAQLLCSQLQREGIGIDISALPSAAAILPHLGWELSTVERTDAGILMTSRGTLPNGGGALPALLVPAHTVFGIAHVPMARQRAYTAQTQNELKQLGMALHMYRNDHKSFPASMEVLWTGERRYLQRPPQGFAAGEMEYHNRGTGPRDVLISVPSPQPGMVLVLFGDAHVESMPKSRLRGLLGRTTDSAAATVGQ